MYWLYRTKKNITNYFYDHPKQKEAVKNVYMLLITALSGLIFAFGFNVFIQPNLDAFSSDVLEELNITVYHLASCGASGLSQSLSTILKIAGVEWVSSETNYNIVYWIFYLSINIPLFFIGFFKVGKKFAIYSLINVLFASIFGILMKSDDPESLINQISLNLANETVARVFFAGMCTGLSSSLAYLIDTTAGGTDIIAFFISEKKSVQVGKWSALFNLVIVTIYSILSTVPLSDIYTGGLAAVDVSTAIIRFLFTIMYMLVITLVVDAINVVNKKCDVQIITPNYNLSQSIIGAIPHGCTIVNAKGGYTGNQLFIIHVTVRKNEVKKVIKLVRQIDNKAFINVFPTSQVYGKFYRKPIQ